MRDAGCLFHGAGCFPGGLGPSLGLLLLILEHTAGVFLGAREMKVDALVLLVVDHVGALLEATVIWARLGISEHG